MYAQCVRKVPWGIHEYVLVGVNISPMTVSFTGKARTLHL